MPRYVDGFVIAIKKSKVTAYLEMAKLGAKVWKEHGALSYYECVGDDLKPFEGSLGFSKLMRLRTGETAVFSYIVYRSKAHRNRVNARVMKDPRMNDPEMLKNTPVDMRRFAMGGFEVIVSW